eukprot:UN33620
MYYLSSLLLLFYVVSARKTRRHVKPTPIGRLDDSGKFIHLHDDIKIPKHVFKSQRHADQLHSNFQFTIEFPKISGDVVKINLLNLPNPLKNNFVGIYNPADSDDDNYFDWFPTSDTYCQSTAVMENNTSLCQIKIFDMREKISIPIL